MEWGRMGWGGVGWRGMEQDGVEWGSVEQGIPFLFNPPLPVPSPGLLSILQVMALPPLAHNCPPCHPNIFPQPGPLIIALPSHIRCKSQPPYPSHHPPLCPTAWAARISAGHSSTGGLGEGRG